MIETQSLTHLQRYLATIVLVLATVTAHAAAPAITVDSLASQDCDRPRSAPARAETETQAQDNTIVRKGYLDGPYGQIHYYEAGSGPALILSHQSPVSARAFERAMPYLAAAGLRVIAVDTPGYGNSDVPAEPPTIADYADAFVAVLDQLGLERANFLGHHTGAMVLGNFAARYPERVDSLILNGPLLLTADELQQAMEHVAPGPHPIYADGSHLQQRWDRRVRFSPGWTDVSAMHRRLVDQLWAGPTAWYGHNAALSYDMHPDFMLLQGKVLILTNTGDDIYDLAQLAHELRPEFEYFELQGGTHDIVDEQPQEWSRIVARFILGPTAVLPNDQQDASEEASEEAKDELYAPAPFIPDGNRNQNPQTGKLKGQTLQIKRVLLMVKDLKTSLDFYENVMGLEVYAVDQVYSLDQTSIGNSIFNTPPGTRRRVAQLNTSNETRGIALREIDAAFEVPQQPRLTTVLFEASNIMEIHDRATAAGVTVINPNLAVVPARENAPELRYMEMAILDPDGHIITFFKYFEDDAEWTAAQAKYHVETEL